MKPHLNLMISFELISFDVDGGAQEVGGRGKNKIHWFI